MSVFFIIFHLRLAEQDVDEVSVGRVLFQLLGDGVMDAGGLLHHRAPLLVAAAVGKDRDATPCETADTLRRESTAAAGGKPKVFGLTGSHDECRLLALHYAYMGIGPLW